jgi:hypothetical protein
VGFCSKLEITGSPQPSHAYALAAVDGADWLALGPPSSAHSTPGRPAFWSGHWATCAARIALSRKRSQCRPSRALTAQTWKWRLQRLSGSSAERLTAGYGSQVHMLVFEASPCSRRRVSRALTQRPSVRLDRG